MPKIKQHTNSSKVIPNLCSEHTLIICHFQQRPVSILFSIFAILFRSQTEGTFFHREQDLLSSDSDLEVRINGVKVSQSSSELGVASKNLRYERTHRKAVPSLLHFLFIIGPLGSEIRQDGLIYASSVRMRYITSLSAKVMLILLPRP